MGDGKEQEGGADPTAAVSVQGALIADPSDSYPTTSPRLISQVVLRSMLLYRDFALLRR